MRIKFLPKIIAGLFIAAPLITSCLDDDTTNIIYSSETSITSFRLGTLYVEVHGVDKEGNDSVYMDTLTMSNYPFAIDQINRTIENKDSLPVGTDLSHVTVNITADTEYILYGKIKEEGEEAKDTIWNASDTINFAVAPKDGLQFKVVAYSGMIGRPYSVKINVHKQDPDSLQWTNGLLGNEFNAGVLTRQKAVYADNKIYVFGVDMNGQTVAECMEIDSDNNPGKWTSVKLPQNTDSYSATICNGTIYFLADGCLFTLTSYGYRQCSSVTDITQLLAGTLSNGEGLLYTRIGEDQFPTYNVYSQEWNDSDAELEDCPSTSQRISSVNIPLTYNDKINRTILFGYNEADPKGYGFVATRLTNDDSWTTYDYARIDTFRCPNIIDPTMIYYDKKLYAFGGQIATRAYTYAPFSIFFSSTDNGLTWQPVTENVTFPKGSNSFQQYYKGEGSYSCVVDKNNFIWVVWEDGQMCRGRINHFGFAPKWD